ncbi:MAG: S9 family peptidase, partial [Bacteroidota bacterium]
SQQVVTPEDILSMDYCSPEQISPDGKQVIYNVLVQRSPNEKPGPAHVRYFLMDLKSGESRQLVNDTLKIGSPRFSMDGKYLAFLYKHGKDKRQVWQMPVKGGDLKKLTHAESNVSAFEWHPKGEGIAYLAQTPRSEKDMELEKRGYDFTFFEENLRNTNLYYVHMNGEDGTQKLKQLTTEMNVWDLNFDYQGDQIAFSASEKNLIDHRYMFRKIYVVDLNTGMSEVVVEDRGKLGNLAFSPDGKQLAFTSALHIHDHAVSQALVLDLETKQVINLTPSDFRGHMSWIQWKNDENVMIYSDEGVYPKLSQMPSSGGDRKIVLDAEKTGVVFSTPVFTKGFDKMIFTGTTPYMPYNLYLKENAADVQKLTDLNNHFKNRKYGEQEVFQFSASDGVTIEGILIKPVDYNENENHPLILYVHGGPEAHHSNGWLSQYSTPGQVMAGKGYMVAYINYRASTGYGVDFGMEGFEDAAGAEFDDLADAIRYLTDKRGADRERVGMAGGSYGGYASAWFATRYTRYVNAVCMFVGISNLISKKGTTDIPYEELLVHAGKLLEDSWMFNLERSPVYWAHQSETATLIYGGADDSRVHPSQSLELYRRMKMNDHPAVRLVQYPGEGHGNRKQVGRIDVLYRQIDWFDWYVKNNKPLDGPMPPLDISDKYGLDWQF